MQAINSSDWVKFSEKGSTPLATTEKSLKGYLSRSFGIKGIDSPNSLCFQRNENGTQTVTGSAGTLYDYTNDDHPTLNIGNLPIPEVLKDVLYIKGKQY